MVPAGSGGGLRAVLQCKDVPAGGTGRGVTVFAVIPNSRLLRVRDLVFALGRGNSRFLTPFKKRTVFGMTDSEETQRGHSQGQHGLDRSRRRADVFRQERRTDPPVAARGNCPT